MKRILIALLFVLTNTFAQNEVRFIDTEEKYYDSIIYHRETNDCSVRAVAEGFNLGYKKSLDITKSWGRKRRRGILVKHFLEGVHTDFKDNIVSKITADPKTTSSEMMNVVEDGYTYIILCINHVFVLEQRKKGSNKWYVKGNKRDLDREIFAYIKIKM